MEKVLLNKTAYLPGGGTKICQYDESIHNLEGLWITVFVLMIILNTFAIVGNVIVIIACFLQKKKPPFIIYITALAFTDLLYAFVAPLYSHRLVRIIYHYSITLHIIHSRVAI